MPKHDSKRRKTEAKPATNSPRNSASQRRTSFESINLSKAGDLSTLQSITANQHHTKPICDGVNGLTDDLLPLNTTLHADFAHHEPITMFPDPSSTVPNATATQRRILETCAGLGEVTEGTPFEMFQGNLAPDPSLPFSELFRLTPASNGDQSELPTGELPSLHSTTPHDILPQEINSQMSPHDRSTLPYASARSPSIHEVGDDDIAAHKSTLLLNDVRLDAPEQLSNACSKSPPGVQRGPKKLQRAQDGDGSPPMSSADDLATMDLPAENYKPRPSRSRSTKCTVEQPIDWSARPEKMKKASKRCRTEASTEGGIEPTTPQKIQQICDMGFTPSSTSQALKRHDGQVTHTIEWLIVNGIGEDELASQRSSQRKGRSKNLRQKISLNDADVIPDNTSRDRSEEQRRAAELLLESIEAGMAVKAPEYTDFAATEVRPATESPSKTAAETSPRVQVVINKKSSVTRTIPEASGDIAHNTSSRRRKTTLDQPDAGSVPLPESITVLKPTSEKKRGRGRPKKENVNSEAPAEATLTPPVQAIEAEDHSEKLATPEPDPSTQQIAAPTASLPRTKTASPKAKSGSPKIGNEAVSQSPNRGKVPYRVGLSKRVRVASLLRSVRK